MLNNSDITIYHCVLDEETRLETWKRKSYKKVWWFGGTNATLSKGVELSNNVEIRIPYNNELDINEIGINDIVVKGILEKDITRQQDLENEIVFNITAIKNNNFGNSPHIHLSCK